MPEEVQDLRTAGEVAQSPSKAHRGLRRWLGVALVGALTASIDINASFIES